jgi:AcrR family transcriptional regulator
MPRSPRQPASAGREHHPKPSDRASASTPKKKRREPKRTQRERLLDAIIELSAQAGYQSVSIAQVSAHAGVSSATFYECFADKEDCMLGAYRAVAERVFGHMRPMVPAEGDWSATARVLVGGLLSALQSDPNAGRVLFVEGLTGGRRIREERKRVLEEFERRVQEFLDSPPKQEEMLDIPATAVMGALRTIVSRHLRSYAEDRLAAVAADGLQWLESYARGAGAERWSTGPRALLKVAPAQRPRVREPARLPRGRHRLPAGVVARSHRERIIYGTAEVMMSKGYANTTVADIVAEAGISREVFYEHFSDKQHAFMEAQQHPTQYILDACSAAYFSVEEWPERVWRAMRVLIGLIAEAPAMSHLRLVECYAAGPEAIRRAEEITRSFTFFLEEGYGCGEKARRLPRLSSEAITGAIFEILQRRVSRGEAAELPRHLPQIVYIAIAPFLGAEEAIEVIEKLSTAEPVRERG